MRSCGIYILQKLSHAFGISALKLYDLSRDQKGGSAKKKRLEAYAGIQRRHMDTQRFSQCRIVRGEFLSSLSSGAYEAVWRQIDDSAGI